MTIGSLKIDKAPEIWQILNFKAIFYVKYSFNSYENE